MIYSRQFLVISFLCRKTGLQTLVNFNWKMSRKTLKMDDLLEAVVDDKVIEILLDRLTDRMTERLSLMVKEENAAQTAELETSLTASITSKLETSLTASITSKLESSLVNIANSVFNNLISPYYQIINTLEEENKIMRSHLDPFDMSTPDRRIWYFMASQSHRCRKPPLDLLRLLARFRHLPKVTLKRRKLSSTSAWSLSTSN